MSLVKNTVARKNIPPEEEAASTPSAAVNNPRKSVFPVLVSDMDGEGNLLAP
jgi:hypothetical protein